jgi:putative colanic acid biosynthesis UDP-glucose lipid carrier transferase
MSYVPTDLPGSTKLPAHLVDANGAVPARVGKGRLAALRTRTTWFSLSQRAIACRLVDGRRVIIGDRSNCLHFFARAMATGLRPIRSFDFPTVPASSAGSSVPAPRAAADEIEDGCDDRG